MTHRTHTRRPHPLQLAVIVGSTLCLGLAAGCGEGDEAKQAVQKAGRTFTAVALGDADASSDYSQQKYKETEQQLSAHASDSNGFAEAAAVGLASSRKGMATLASQQAVEIEKQAMHQARVIRAQISEWLVMNAIAQAAGRFNPSDDLDEIARLIRLRRDDIDRYQAQMEEIDERIAQLEAQIQDLRANASEQRNRAGELELQIPRVSAQQAAELAKQVREYTLRADQFDLEAMRTEGVVGQLRPQAREISLNVDKARSQVQLLQDSSEELRERAQASKDDAQRARQAALDAAQRIQQSIRDYQSFRDDEVQSANEETVSLIRGAINAARDARDAAKQSAAINRSQAHQMLAETAMRQANGEREEAMLYTALKETGIEGDWDARIDAANQQADEHEETARQAFLDAANAIRSVRAQGDLAERINATAARLEALGGMEPETIEPDPADLPEEAPETDQPETDQPAQSAQDLSAMTLDEIMAQVPEEMRDTLAEQLQGMLDALAAIDDADTLRAMLTQIDEQAASMPEEIAIGFDFVRQQVQNRIDEIESDG